jgi:histidyl-tRNA synthetase
MQCDFDTIGTMSNSADIETLFVINDLFEKIGIERFTIRVNNRKVLNGLLEKCGLSEHAVGILRCLDKLDKIGRDAVAAEMVERVGITAAGASQVLDMAQLKGSPDEILRALDGMLAGSQIGETGVNDLRELFASVDACGWPEGRVSLDVAIARGLDYYTGTIYETLLGDLPEIGSVCSGGRYDNLADLFTAQQLPGVGASLGLDRMLAALEELGRTKKATTPAPVLVTMFDAGRVSDYLQLGRRLRKAGIGTEVYPEAKNIGKQMKYADRKGFRLAVIAGGDEFAAGQFQVKDLQNGTQASVAAADLVAHISALLSPQG